jgi:predicted amidohydrolase YtcJ
MIRASNEQLAERLDQYRMIGYRDNHLTVRTVKLSIDGALGPRGAWLLEPYTDAPHLSGLNLIPIPDVRETARLALRHNFQLAVHAIGDRANREVLDIYEDTFATRPGSDTLRWRIEHAQHIAASDIPRFGKLGIIAAMQANHCTSDASWVPDRLGDTRAAEGAYMWKTLAETGAVVTNGTDAPVEKVNPMASFYAAVTRRLADGSTFYPDQRMSREEALRSYTINNAIAAFEEDIKGTLSPGKLADITVLSQDIMTIDEEMILDTKTAMTIVGGQILFDRANETAE